MSARGLAWYKRDPIAFLDGVQGMGPDLIGAYAVLLDLLYARGGTTRRDDRHLAGILGCSVRKSRTMTDDLIELGKITQSGDELTNKRAAAQAMRAADLSDMRSEAGRKGGVQSGEVRRKSRETSVKHSRTDRETSVKHSREKTEVSETNDLVEASALSKTQADKRREEKKVERKIDPVFQILIDVLSEGVALDFIEHRKSLRKPLSEVAAKRIVEALRVSQNPDGVVGMSIMNGWQGVFPERGGVQIVRSDDGNARAERIRRLTGQ